MVVLQNTEEYTDHATVEIGEHILTAITTMSRPAAVGIGLIAIPERVSRFGHRHCLFERCFDKISIPHRSSINACATTHKQGIVASQITRCEVTLIPVSALSGYI